MSGVKRYLTISHGNMDRFLELGVKVYPTQGRTEKSTPQGGTEKSALPLRVLPCSRFMPKPDRLLGKRNVEKVTRSPLNISSIRNHSRFLASRLKHVNC